MKDCGRSNGEGNLGSQICFSEDAEKAECIRLRQGNLSLALEWLLQGMSSVQFLDRVLLGISSMLCSGWVLVD